MINDDFDDIVLLNDEGEEELFVHLLTFIHEGERYVALSPKSAEDSDETPVVILKVTDSEGEDVYVSIDNEVLEEEVYLAFLELVEEMEEGEE